MNKKGFTLIELMVVVAIIGILASVAVPQFRKFQAKAKQANAKAELSGIYMAEQTFFTEFGTYSANLASIGYSPDGFGSAACPGTAAQSSAPVTGVTRYYRTGFSGSGGVTFPASLPTPCPVTYYVANVGATPTAVPVGDAITAQTFTAASSGDVYGGGIEDRWTMDENKALINTQSGLGAATATAPSP